MLSPGTGAEGVVIARRQADIIVSAVDLPAGRVLADPAPLKRRWRYTPVAVARSLRVAAT